VDTFRKYVNKYLVLMRPKTMMIYIFPLTLGFAAGMSYSDHVAGWRIVCAYLSFLAGSFFSSTLNFYADVDADRLHNDMYKDQPISRQPFVTGEMGKVETPLIFAISTCACIGFGLLVSYQFAIMIFISIYFTLGILYSHPWFRFKAKPVLDVVTNAAGAVLVLMAGWKLASPTTWPPVIPLVFGFIFSGTLYLPSVANDVPFDTAAGFRTSGVVFGAKRLLNAMIPLCGLMAVVAALTLIGPYGWQFKLFVAGALPGAIVFTWGMHLLYEPPHIRFNTGLMIYPIIGMLVFYLVYALQKALL
jgi:4-hydroxybenzoate polyprenyltransferase